MTNDELTVLMIAAEGQSMIAVGRWEKPLHDLVVQGLMKQLDSVNYVITAAGRKAAKAEEAQRDGDFARALQQCRRQFETIHVGMTVFGLLIAFDLTYDPAFASDVNTRLFLEHNGACEPEVVHLMRRVVRPGDFVINGGANIGFFTLVMSRLVGDQGHVEAFEPSTLNFKKLQANLELNHVENVTVINRALWSEDAEVTLHQGLDSSESSLMPFDQTLNNVKVGALTLDKWCLAYDQAPRLLKLDIEGAELQALIGAGKMLSRGIDFIACEMNLDALDRFGTSQMDLRDYMAGKGYSTFLLSESGDCPQLVGREKMIVTDKLNSNILFSTVEKVDEAWGAALS